MPIPQTVKRRLDEMKITKEIPVYSTAFLKSPVIVGILKPRIYLPIPLISNFKETEMRYMLLHELQHYRHNDIPVNHLINLAGVIYWFHPLVRYTLKEMRSDREIACDTSVLEMLEEKDYSDYGNTLINFAEMLSISTFPFAAGLSGNIKQIKKRIINIASENIIQSDLSAYFKEYEGSFVLYNTKNDSWYIYDMDQALFMERPEPD